MGFGYILTGLLFLFNPNVNIFDIFPDFIGYIFIIFGLSKLAFLDDRFRNAKKISLYLLVLNIIKTLMSFYYIKTKYDKFAATFIFGSVDIVLLVFLFSNIYSGIEYLCEYHGGEKHLGKIKNASVMSYVLAFSKNIFAFIPDSLTIFTQNLGQTFSGKISRASVLLSIKPYLTMLCVIISLFVGIYYAVLTTGFFKKIISDKNFVSSLKKIYIDNVFEGKSYENHKTFLNFFILMTASSVFMLNFTVDSINFLPDFICYVLLLVAEYVLFSENRRKNKVMYATFSLILISVLSYIFKFYTSMGVNFATGHDSYFMKDIPAVNNGRAIPCAYIISVFQYALYSAVTFIVWKAASRKISKAANTNFYEKPLQILYIIYAALSAAAYVLPLYTAKYNYLFLENTSENAYFQTLADNINLACCYISLFAAVIAAVIIIYVLKIKKKVLFYI